MRSRDKIRFIAGYGSRYRDELLGDWVSSRSAVLVSPQLAMRRWLNCSFMRGRRDQVSVMFLNRANEAIAAVEQQRGATSGLAPVWTTAVRTDLESEMVARQVNNQGDRSMVLATFDRANAWPEDNFNIVARAERLARARALSTIHRELDDLPWVGDKLACFFLRDVVDVYGVSVTREDEAFVQPIDTWVFQLAEMIGLAVTWRTVKQTIIDECLAAGVSPRQFNQGAWYIGTHSLNVLLETVRTSAPRPNGRLRAEMRRI